MQTAKQLLLLDDKPVLRWVAEAACRSRLQEVHVIVGAEAEAVAAALEGLPLQVFKNESWLSGQSSSLRAGVARLGADCDAALFILADQPLAEETLFNRLIEEYEAGGKLIAPVCAGRRGNPVLFDLKRYRAALLAVQGDEGARSIIASEAAALRLIEVAEQEIFCDLDTMDDYRRMKSLWRLRRESETRGER